MLSYISWPTVLVSLSKNLPGFSLTRFYHIEFLNKIPSPLFLVGKAIVFLNRNPPLGQRRKVSSYNRDKYRE